MRARLDARSAPLQAALLAACLAILTGVGVYGPTQHGDINLYHRYAVTFWAGSPPLRQLPAEYPPLAIVPFSLTMLPSIPSFPWVFAGWMAALYVGGAALIGRLFTRAAGVRYLVYLGLAAVGTLLSRYDLVPALVVVGALAAARRRRFLLAYLLLGLGTLLKLYPVFLVPAVVIVQQRTLAAGWRPARQVIAGAAIYAAVVGLGFGAAYLLAGGQALAAFGFAGRRPLQVESVAASLLWLLSATGHHAAYDHSFNSFNLVGDAAPALSLLADGALVIGCLRVYQLQAQGRLSLEHAFLALVTVALVTSRVFSPQYLIWVLPLVAIAGGWDTLWLLIAVLTAAIWPIGYTAEGLHGPSHHYSWPFLGLILVRNAALCLAAGRLLLGFRPVGGGEAAAARERAAA